MFEMHHRRCCKSGWEQKIASLLERKNIEYCYEPFTIHFTNGLKYTPNFVLNRRINGRQVILEPHNPSYGFNNILEFVEKYGDKYFLILLVRNDDINKIPNIFRKLGEVWPIEYVNLIVRKLADF